MCLSGILHGFFHIIGYMSIVDEDILAAIVVTTYNVIIHASDFMNTTYFDNNRFTVHRHLKSISPYNEYEEICNIQRDIMYVNQSIKQ